MTPGQQTAPTTLPRILWPTMAAISPVLVILAAFLLQPGISYNRWDNFETGIPFLAYAHKLLLSGVFPNWNPHQFLGEPVHALTQAGALYAPYTLSYFITHSLGLGDEWLSFVIVLLHLPFAGAGWYFLLRHFNVRQSFSYVAAVTATSGGCFTALASVWMFVAPVSAWIPWIILGVLGVLDGRRPARSALLLVVGLTAVAFVGYAQLLAYLWLLVVVLALLHSMIRLRRSRNITRLVVPLVSAALLSAPAVVPTLNLLQYTSRTERMAPSAFLERSIVPEALAGALLPLYKLRDGAFDPPASVMLHQGAWVIPALVLAGFFRGRGRSKRRKGTASLGDTMSDEADMLRRSFWVAALAALLFMVFALGEHGLLYPLTYGVPLWSSFRWPFKFLVIANPLCVMCAALALETGARRMSGALRLGTEFYASLFVAIVSLSLLVRVPSTNLGTPAGILCLATAIPLMLVVGLAGHRWARGLLVALVLVQTTALVAISQDLGFKTYREPYGSVGPEALGIDRAYRALPLTVPEILGQPPAIQHYDLLLSATTNDYFSATGGAWGMTPTWVSELLPTNVFGVLPPSVLLRLLPANLLRSFNVRYVIAGKEDARSRNLVRIVGGYHVVKELEDVLVFANDDALPRAYFASHLFTYSRDAFFAGMIDNGAPLRSAFVENAPELRPGPLPEARIRDEFWSPNVNRFTVDAPRGGLLVVTMTWFPEWQASVDGRPARVLRVNGAVQAIEVRPGAKTVVLRFVPRSLYQGVALSIVGLAIFIGWSLRLVRGAGSAESARTRRPGIGARGGIV